MFRIIICLYLQQKFADFKQNHSKDTSVLTSYLSHRRNPSCTESHRLTVTTCNNNPGPQRVKGLPQPLVQAPASVSKFV